jgi:hypothetical protein
MQHSYICVAGIDAQTGMHVRPTARERLSVNLLARVGGPFDIGRLVDLGRTSRIGRPPEVEDHQVDLRRVVHRSTLAADEFWARLQQTAKRRLAEIFGPDLTMTDQQACTVAAGRGQASLGCLRPAARPTLYLRPRSDRSAQVRMRLTDGERDVDASVTDIRLYNKADSSPNAAMVERIAAQLARDDDVLLSVGLTRPYQPHPDQPAAHWLQVNNIHFGVYPLWQLRHR